MGVYTLNMLAIAIELAMHNNVYEDIAIKFFEHFLYIADAMNHLGGSGLWNHEDGFYYDMLMLDNGQKMPMRIHSMVGLLPLLAVEIMEPRRVRRASRVQAPGGVVHQSSSGARPQRRQHR